MFTLTIPITVISAIYGMNVKIPGGNEMPWTLFGPYTTFILLLMGSAIDFISHALVFLLFWMDYSEVKKITVNN